MQLGTEIGKMTRKLFTGFSKSHPWMLNTAGRLAVARAGLINVQTLFYSVSSFITG